MLDRALALHQAGRFVEVAGLYGEILRHDPTDFAAVQGLAHLYFQWGRLDDALRILDSALTHHPKRAELWNNRGAVLATMRRLDDAAASFTRALAIDPVFPGACANRANAFLELGRYGDAARDYRDALRAKPDTPYARGALLQCKLQCCDWSGLEREWELALREMRAGQPVITPQAATALCHSPADQLRAARILTAVKYPPRRPLWQSERTAHDRIRVAYLSADFHGHATATLMAGVFEHHDRTAFETIAISFGADDASPMRHRLENAFERFIPVRGQSDADIAALMRKMEIDLVIDLKGHTSGARPGILAYRPAPIQVNYLGYPATMGAPYIDYLIADRVVIPEKDEVHYDEKIVALPDCYQPNDRARMMAEQTPSRMDAGLPPTGMVFCCFNNPYKITPDMFALWMNILHDVPDSVLWLLDDNKDATRNLRQSASARGISPQRLVFAPHAMPNEHLARHRLADLFLDTSPYNAHTTASDALWMGLPVITCIGETFAGRVASSLLEASGMQELIAQSHDEYRCMAIRLARDAKALAGIKAKIIRNRETSPLFDAGRTTRHLESAYRTMWKRFQNGLPPAGFAVTPENSTAAPGPD